MTAADAMRIVLARVPDDDQEQIARYARKWVVCHCDERLIAMRRRRVWGQVTFEGDQWCFHIDDEVFSRLPAEAQIGLLAHELGHAACYRSDDSGCYGTEEEADDQAATWGFADEVAALRREAAAHR